MQLHERAAVAAELSSRVDAGLEHARQVEAISRATADRLGALRGATLQARIHLTEHGEIAATAILRPALQDVADLGPSPGIVDAQAQLARSLMMGSQYAEAVEWCNRVLSAPDVATDEQLVDVLVTKGTAQTDMANVREGEVVLRGAIKVADRLGYHTAALRARNNILGVTAEADLADVLRVVEEGYEIADRYGLRTWILQFAHVALETAFEMGDWESWVEETTELHATGFYGAWRLALGGLRDAFRGDLEASRDAFARADEMVGDTSSQANAAIGAHRAGLAAASCDWAAVLPYARLGWEHHDPAPIAVAWGVTAGLAAAEPNWLGEAAERIARFEKRGRLWHGLREYFETAEALLDGRLADARVHYLRAREALNDVGAHFWLAVMNVGVGARGGDEFRDASSAADKFFARLGAQAFVERYRKSVVPQPLRPAEAAPTERAGITTS